jgi:hypothetical protein
VVERQAENLKVIGSILFLGTNNILRFKLIYKMGFTYNVNIFFKKINFFLISKKTIVLLVIFLIPLDSNILICSYLQNELVCFENNFTSYLIALIFYLFYRIYNFKKSSNINISYYLTNKKFKSLNLLYKTKQK